MSSIIKSVDKTIVNFEEKFTYDINASFSGVEGNISSAKILDFIPDYIEYTLPKSINHVKEITETIVEGGTEVVFDFGEITDLGIAISFYIECKFKLGTDNNASFENKAQLYINEALDDESIAQEVTLLVEEDFILSETIIAPSNAVGAPGSRVIYSIVLRNLLKSQGGEGDPGAKLKNINIYSDLPEGLTLDTNYPIRGIDVSNNEYRDTRYDNQFGEVVGNGFEFEIPEYYGTRYRITFVANIDTEAIVGEEITHTSELEVESILRDTASRVLTIGESNYLGSISKYGPSRGDLGDDITFELRTGNYGNQDLINLIIKDDIPKEVKVKRIKTGSYQLNVINVLIDQEYDIEYELNNSDNFILLGTFNTNTSQTVILPEVAQNDKITAIKATIPNYGVGIVTSQPIVLDGEIIEINENKEFMNISSIQWIDESGESTEYATHTTIEDDLSELDISKSIIGGNNEDVIPGEVIRYKLQINTDKSKVNNPIITDLISDKVEYIGNESYSSYKYYENTTTNFTNENIPQDIPLVLERIDNYKDTNRTLIRYKLDGYLLRQKDKFIVEFDVKVKPGSIGEIENTTILGNTGDKGIVSDDNVYIDEDDRDDDGVYNEQLAQSNIVKSNILYYSILSSNKKVKGALDEVYSEQPIVGKTYSGGAVDYILTVTNEGNLDFEYIEIVDILPHIGDTGVILTNQNRKSEFRIYNVSDIKAYIKENNQIISTENIEIMYSKSYDPVRFSKENFGDDIIGTVDDWSTNLPSTVTDTKAVKIIFSQTTLKANQSIEIHMNALAPIGVEVDKVAWNSFAVKATYITELDEQKKLIPVEPEKVGVEIVASEKGSIEGIAWIDENKNGYIDNNEIGMNEVIVKLYTQDKTLISQTLTVSDTSGNTGFYKFDNLEFDSYYVEFERPIDYFYTVKIEGGDSKVDMATGMSDLIQVQESDKNILEINAGFVNKLDILELLLQILNEDIFKLSCETNEIIIENMKSIINEMIEILTMIEEVIINVLNSSEITDMGYKAQLERLLHIVTNIKTKLSFIIIPQNYCNTNILPYLLYNMTIVILDLLEIGMKFRGISVYRTRQCENVCLSAQIYEKLIQSMINDITLLQQDYLYIQDILNVLYADINKYTKSYVASYIPKPTIPTPINNINMSHYCREIRNNNCCK